jgi:hypothetical protein
MNEVEFVVWRSKRAWDWLEETVADVTSAQANWWPPGTANSIGATYLHIVINTDVEINRLILDRPPLVEAQWHGDVGQGGPYEPERFDRRVRHRDVDWAVLRAYGRAVHAAFALTLDDLTPDQLDQPVDMTRAGLGMWPGRELYCLHGFEHVRIHGGEIACLKGMQGGVGWAESDAFRAAVVVEDARDR